ncbi:cation:proton antiporter domain-containing protein [Mycolicibacterium lacusdiani]|jgi:NhaP-type Na+/H+ or K+/H+ antiporter|uniref:cation:proton antiporter domain-containing protein n=1 Tax=Mycolicibacterium lacusdiani TaxID=2895283 RepID=UPI001F029142|nr:cation:proton antiporter [Mycolicibacterium lacusdiani]
MATETAFVLTLLVLCYAVVSGVVKRWYVAPALIFVLVGMALGPFGFDLIEGGPDTSTFTVLAQLALTLILFNQAAELDLSAVLRRREVTFRLLAVGIPLAIALGVITAVLVLPVMPLWEAVCLAAIVAPTEVALIHALLADRRIPERIRQALSTESGFYDGFALAALLAALALASERTAPEAEHWGWFLIRTELVSAGVGVAVGVAGGWVIGHSRRRDWMGDTWAQLATVAIALVCFQVGEHLHGSGFVAAFAGGLAFAFASRRVGHHPDMHVSDAAAQLLELLVFALFGGYAVIVGWREASWRVVLFAVVALLLVRLAAVSLALLRSDVPVRDRLFIGWFGPRGISTLVLGLLVVERGDLVQQSLIVQVVVVTVTLSLVLHSLSAWPGIRWLLTNRSPATRENV